MVSRCKSMLFCLIDASQIGSQTLPEGLHQQTLEIPVEAIVIIESCRSHRDPQIYGRKFVDTIDVQIPQGFHRYLVAIYRYLAAKLQILQMCSTIANLNLQISYYRIEVNVIKISQIILQIHGRSNLFYMKHSMLSAQTQFIITNIEKYTSKSTRWQ